MGLADGTGHLVSVDAGRTIAGAENSVDGGVQSRLGDGLEGADSFLRAEKAILSTVPLHARGMGTTGSASRIHSGQGVMML